MPIPRDPDPRAPGRSAHRTVPAGAVECAQDMLDTVPALMDALRGSLRGQAVSDLSIPQFRCLAYVARNRGCSIGQVAAFLGVRMPTASAMVDRLARAGALESQPDASDRRRVILQLTEAGRARLGRIRRAARDEIAVALAGCDAAEIEMLRTAFGILRRAMGVVEPADDSDHEAAADAGREKARSETART